MQVKNLSRSKLYGVVLAMAVILGASLILAGPASTSPITLEEFKAWFDLWHLVDWTPVKQIVNDIQAKLGQGLVGENHTHSFVFNTAGTQEWTIPEVPAHPKKLSLWVDVTKMKEGDQISVTVTIDREGTGEYYIYWDGSAYSTWEWAADKDTRFHWLVVDQLSISTNWRVKVKISYTPVAPPVTIHCEAIIEEA